MRAFHGQFSDNQPIRRNTAEKEKQLRDLKETLAAMKSHTSPSLRESIRNRIVTLEQELRAAARKEEARAAENAARPQTTRPQRRPRREI